MSRKPPSPKATNAKPGAVKQPARKSVVMPAGTSLTQADTPPLGGTRWCTYCLGPRDATGGMWMILSGGATRRWLCLSCASKHRPFAGAAASSVSP